MKKPAGGRGPVAKKNVNASLAANPPKDGDGGGEAGFFASKEEYSKGLFSP